MTNLEIINHINSLNEFVSKDKSIPGKLGYAISRNIKIMMDEYNIYAEERKKILNGESESEISAEKMQQIQEILEVDVDLNLIKIDSTVMDRCDNLSAKDWLALEFMIKEE